MTKSKCIIERKSIKISVITALKKNYCSSENKVVQVFVIKHDNKYDESFLDSLKKNPNQFIIVLQYNKCLLHDIMEST